MTKVKRKRNSSTMGYTYQNGLHDWIPIVGDKKLLPSDKQSCSEGKVVGAEF